MRKIVFMDIDGTLVNEKGVIPQSAKRSVQQARENGHLVFICTGRSKAELFPEILEVGFDGIIGAAGGYIEVEEEVVLHERIKKADLGHLVEFFNKHKVDFYLESNGGLFASANCKKHIRAIVEKMISENPEARGEIEKGLKPFHDILLEGHDLIRDDVNKISFLGSDLPFEVIEQEFQSKFMVIRSTVPAFGDNSGELSVPGIHKATAIETLIQHLNLAKENTYAYGDGINDIEMLQYVQYGIAMGNAKEAVKKAADDITDTHDEDGIFNSFKKYGLI
ncbi:Cof subfamily protein (haloacid dehalogenase superfamily)/HAD superfamily hydrolase (TIGR01484 family) [Planomicrobium soli]|uniref:Cof subfamily protein (Haloacid dehalogenase superfamily)/HAD superfamily hydrolase (TIGR01484 family) n=1 Tax=Planomicrobium soli TaxID=1176648 RepID=A0A2P8GQR6_9BACL|nr:HAD family hydrolase [Planomicrobium soli]PSL36310.1 Cof subfamily protein (haloacid dehalogenase superfamily)/HAD superfamily hydrolase (TIGR01484 family) [Planomicrobium soli]